MKKDSVKQLLCLCLLVIGVVVVYTLGYRFGKQLDGGEFVTQQQISLEGRTNEELILHGAELVLESHNLDTDEIQVETMQIPVEFIGLSKSEVIDFITSHSEQFQQEKERVKNISMISFAADMLVIRKDYVETMEASETAVPYESEHVYHYYMVLENESLVVYKQDKTTVFMETGIHSEELEEEDREILKQGIGIRNISELYRYLESYTS